jgi:phytoene synthase
MTAAVVHLPLAPIAIARAEIERGSKSFAMASKLLDARTRDQTAVVYAFCRRVDDAVDEAPWTDQPAAIVKLQGELAAIYRGTPRDPVLAAFGHIAWERSIPRYYPEQLLAGMAMDVYGARYRYFTDLHRYCFRVAGVVGLMMCHVFGVRDDSALVPAARLGIAMQLTNICRDVGEDWRRGRLYLPDDLLARHGAGGLASELDRPLPRSARVPLARAVRELLELADEHYRAADAGIPALPWRAAIGVRAARSIYAAIGERIRANHCDVFAGRAIVPRNRKLALALRAAARSLVTAIHPARAFTRAPRIPTRILGVHDVPLT